MEEERRGAEKGAEKGAERGQRLVSRDKTGEREKRMRETEKEKDRRWAKPTLKGNAANVHWRCSEWLTYPVRP